MTPPDKPEEPPSALSRLERALAGFGEPRDEDTTAEPEPEPGAATRRLEVDDADVPDAERSPVDGDEPDDWDAPATTASSSVLDIASAVEAVERLSASEDAEADSDADVASESSDAIGGGLSRPVSDADEIVFAATAAATDESGFDDDDEGDERAEGTVAASAWATEPDEDSPLFRPADLRARVKEFTEEAAGDEDLRVAVAEGSDLAEAPEADADPATTRDAAASWNRDLGDQQLPYFLVEEEPVVPEEPVPTLEELRQRNPRPVKEAKPASVVRTLAEIPILLIVAALIAFLVKTFLAQAYYIPSGSMLPQLRIDDRVVVSKLSYKLHDPRRGDIVVFDDPRNGASDDDDDGNLLRKVGEGIGIVQPSTDEFIKRVIGLPGDTVEGRDGHVYVNGRLLIEPYLVDTVVTSDFAKTKVREGHLWVMGDNRSGSADSRVFGQIEIDSIVGRAMVTVWPFAHIEFL